MPTDQKVCLFLVAFLCACIIYIALDEYQRNRKILRKQTFYRGTPPKKKRSKWLFWLPLFLRRRRRRSYLIYEQRQGIIRSIPTVDNIPYSKSERG